MALPKSLTQPLRQGQLTVGAGWRAHFAPFNQAYAVNQGSSVLGPTIYDLEVLGKFLDSSQPAGWFDLGFIKNFRITPGSKVGSIMTGYRGAIRAKYRAEVGEKLSFSFAEMTRMAMKIATGTQLFNVLYSSAAASSSPLGASGSLTVAIGAAGYLPTGLGSGVTQGLPTLFVPAGSGAAFPAGSYIVCDQDYNGSDFGFVGDAGASVFQGAVSDTDFIRKTSDYVACVQTVVPSATGSQDGLILTGPFVGGGNSMTSATGNVYPTAGAKVQKILGFASREGGTTINEWSGIFLLDTVDSSQILLYYPRISPDTYGGFEVANVPNANSLQTYDLPATFDALAFDDPLDGETVVRYSCYYPHAGSNIQI
jgi:hypothetical protein